VAKSIVDIPASNTYNPNLSMTQVQGAKWGFGSEKRKGPIEVAMRNNSPGPGGYNIDSLAFSKNPKFFVGEKIKALKETTNTPGAGTYDPSPEKTVKGQPSYSMKMKLGSSILTNNKNPAPGAYDAHFNNKTSAPKFGFGSSTRAAPKGMTVPGPGAYKVNSTIGDVPAYAMPNRPQEYKYI
jgi:hypothetical protein